MVNSYGFDGTIPETAIAGEYDSENGCFTGRFFDNFDEATIYEESF